MSIPSTHVLRNLSNAIDTALLRGDSYLALRFHQERHVYLASHDIVRWQWLVSQQTLGSGPSRDQRYDTLAQAWAAYQEWPMPEGTVTALVELCYSHSGLECELVLAEYESWEVDESEF